VCENTVLIFYAIEVTDALEIARVAAYTSMNDKFDIIKTSTRWSSSRMVAKFSPMVYMLLATEPSVAMNYFIGWVHMITSKATDWNYPESDVVMVVHNGMCHDHVVLVKIMIARGLNLPKWRFSDSLPIFRVVLRPLLNKRLGLSMLAHMYPPWFMHTRHKVSSDAAAFMNVVTKADLNWQTACYMFSASSDDFIKLVGLNVLRVKY